MPSFVTNSTNYNASIPFLNQSIFWNALPDGEAWDGFALLVDDVERYVGTALNYSLSALDPTLIHFFRLAVGILPSSCIAFPHYRRLLTHTSLPLPLQFTSEGSAGDFTKAATLYPNGTWVDPLPGPS